MINIPKFDKDKEEYITNLMKEFAVENNPICARVEKVQDDCKVDIIDKLMVKDHEIAVLKKALELAIKDKIHFERESFKKVFKCKDCEIMVPKKEQYYIDQAEKELGEKKDV